MLQPSPSASLVGVGTEGRITGAGSAGCCSGLVRHRRPGVDGLLLPPAAALLTAEKPPPRVPHGLGASCCGRRFLFLVSQSRSSSCWTDVHSGVRHPAPSFSFLAGQAKTQKKKRTDPSACLLDSWSSRGVCLCALLDAHQLFDEKINRATKHTLRLVRLR